MNVWRLTAANTIGKEETEPVPEEGKRKIRITKVFVNRSDALLFSGAKKMRYPRIPGRFAVGLIADEGSAHFPKGARVLLHTAFPAPCDGVEKRDFTEDDILLRGFTADGFMRDFIYVTEDELSLLPESVSDEKALLIQHIALADAAVEKLGIHRGEHVAVIGGSMLGVFICRLLIYRQISPILIDSDARRVEFAKSCGIYYTAPEDDKLIDAVEGCIHAERVVRVDPSMPEMRACAEGGDAEMVLVSLAFDEQAELPPTYRTAEHTTGYGREAPLLPFIPEQSRFDHKQWQRSLYVFLGDHETPP